MWYRVHYEFYFLYNWKPGTLVLQDEKGAHQIKEAMRAMRRRYRYVTVETLEHFPNAKKLLRDGALQLED